MLTADPSHANELKYPNELAIGTVSVDTSVESREKSVLALN